MDDWPRTSLAIKDGTGSTRSTSMAAPFFILASANSIRFELAMQQ